MIERNPARASTETYDLLIIGGGICGAMLNLEAARHGLKSLLVERCDFGSATSFNSLRIIHGGLRYLQSLDLPRFKESVEERRWLLRHFPDLVKPLPCLMPLYHTGLKRPSVFHVALRLNDFLSWRRNAGVDPRRHLPPGRVISAAETRHLFPAVSPTGLRGGAVWYDACVPDSQRLLTEVLRWSCALGASALNYVEATGLLEANHQVEGIVAYDRESNTIHEYRAPVVVNASGPWSRVLAKRLMHRDEKRLFQSSIAWNLLFDREALSDHALALTPTTPGGQTYFFHPWKGRLLVGTGHSAWNASSDDPMPSRDVLDKMLEEINVTVPGLDLGHQDIVTVFAGLLPAKAQGRAELASREVIWDHGKTGGPRGLYSAVGIKFTTARRVAEKTLARIYRRQRQGLSREAPTRPEPQTGWTEMADRADGRDSTLSALETEALRRLIGEESVMHLDDLIFRRTTLWETPQTTSLLAARICDLFPWDDLRREQELDALARSFGGRANLSV